MEHIVQFGISVDDEHIKQQVLNSAEKTIIKNLKQDVANKLFQKYYGYDVDPKKDPLSDFATGIIKAVFEENQDAIIEKAAAILADKLARSKRGKEILENI